ncbi:MAG: hypothetical protein N3F09_05845 [Bacteroidia bacterium]|nr:hypothetical protein [Bacteroidia bacterium]
MNPKESLYYALGEAVYAVAFADRKVQPEEEQKFNQIIKDELHKENWGFEVSEIIFKILKKDKLSSKDALENAKKNIEINGRYLNPELKEKMISVMQKVAEAFPPVTAEEGKYIMDFILFLKDIKGDPLFCKN